MNKRQHPTGNGNVFQDFGIPNAEEHLLKAQLVFKTQGTQGHGKGKPSCCLLMTPNT